MARKRSDRVWASPTALVCVLALLAIMVLLVPAARAGAEPGALATAVGRANLDGSGAEKSFTGGGSGDGGDVAVDAGHVYWTRSEPVEGTLYGQVSAIGRAKLNGSRAQQSFVSGLSGSVTGLALDAEHLYWTWNIWDYDNEGNAHVTHGIGRANLDGTGVDQNFISLASSADPIPDVAVDATRIYWTYRDGIGRANLDGTSVDPDFIGGIGIGFAVRTGGIAVDPEHLYWMAGYCVDSGVCGPTIARANLDGSGVQEGFIPGPTAPFHGDQWNDVAVDDEHVYWTGYDYFFRGWIGRADLDGTNFVDRFIGGTGLLPGGLALDDKHLYWEHQNHDSEVSGTAIAPGTQRQYGGKIVVRVKVRAKERLTAKAKGKIKLDPTYQLKPKSVRVATTMLTTNTLKLKPRKKQAARRITRALKRHEKATARISVKLTDGVGNSETERLRVRLKP